MWLKQNTQLSTLLRSSAVMCSPTAVWLCVSILRPIQAQAYGSVDLLRHW